MVSLKTSALMQAVRQDLAKDWFRFAATSAVPGFRDNRLQVGDET